MITTLTYDTFIERIKKRLANGWPNIKFSITDNEILMYVYEATATAITMLSTQGLKLDGIRAVPEGFLTTYKIAASSFVQDTNTSYFSVAMPAPLINLPLGYSISEPYFAGAGVPGLPIILVHARQKGFWNKIPTPDYGVYAWVEGLSFIMDGRGLNLALSGQTLYLRMLSPRSATGNTSDVMTMPDEAIKMVFDLVIDELTKRLQTPKDKTNDGNPQYTQQP